MEYEYGSVMASKNWPKGWEKMLSKIDRRDVYAGDDGTYGIETDPHITVLYGLHEKVHEDLVCRVCQAVDGPIDVDVKGSSTFEKEDYDVLKIDVESDILRKMNTAFKSFPYTNDYEEYKPHMTVAYLKKGNKDKYRNIEKHVPDQIRFPKMKYMPPKTKNPINIPLA